MATATATLDLAHAGCRDVLKMAAERLGWEVTLNTGGTIVWTDTESDAAEQLNKLRKNEWMSWIPGVQDACGKIALSDALEARHVAFWPHSWRVPQVAIQDIAEQIFATQRKATLIVKPDQGSQGSGISLVQSSQELQRALQRLPPEGAIVQQYIDRPMLLDGFKWDARIYALMVPLPQGGHAVFLEEEGLVRVCTEVYVPPTAQNLQHSSVHLTNYSLNKFSDKYVHSADPADATTGCKRTLSAVLRRLDSERPGLSATVWESLGILARETVDAIAEQLSDWQPKDRLQHCFHLIGLDVLLDESGKPWLLEANYRPSLLVDEVHPMAGAQSRADVNRLFAGRRPVGGPRWGKPCRCCLHPSPHVHQLSSVDVAAKLPAIEGAMVIVQRARSGHSLDMWSEGTAYHLV